MKINHSYLQVYNYDWHVGFVLVNNFVISTYHSSNSNRWIGSRLLCMNFCNKISVVSFIKQWQTTEHKITQFQLRVFKLDNLMMIIINILVLGNRQILHQEWENWSFVTVCFTQYKNQWCKTQWRNKINCEGKIEITGIRHWGVFFWY